MGRDGGTKTPTVMMNAHTVRSVAVIDVGVITMVFLPLQAGAAVTVDAVVVVMTPAASRGGDCGKKTWW